MVSMRRLGLVVVFAACGDDGGATAGQTTSGTTGPDVTTSGSSPTTSGPGTDTGGSVSDSQTTTGTAETTGTAPTTGGPTTSEETTASTGPDATTGGETTAGVMTASETTSGTSDESGEDTAVACEDMLELCDALDNNCNDLFDEGCDCTPPDLDLMALDGYTARVILDVPMDLGSYGRLGDVERALGDYWGQPDSEGVLFTLNNAMNSGAGIGAMDQDGVFSHWVVDPMTNGLPPNPYLEYAYEGVIYACTTVAGDWIYKIHADGTVEQFVHHGNCEGIVFGDRGDGVQRLYASNYSTGTVWAIEADGTKAVVASGLPIVVDLAITRPGSAFPAGLYAINQTIDGVNYIHLDNTVTLDFPYSLGFGVGEELSFADPKSAFRDHFYHLSATTNSVQRIAPDGKVQTVLVGPKLNYGLYTTGSVFSTNGAYYFFTNEDELIMRLQACNISGQ